MYVSHHHTLLEQEAIFHLMEEHPLAAWVCQGPEGLIANQLPFVLDRNHGPHGTLIAHVSRANPVWRALAGGLPCVVVFTGPQAYITPGWYPGKTAHGKVVPTWNYSAVHAHGTARAVEDPAWLLDMLRRLTHASESARDAQWQVEDAPEEYIDKMLRAIVGIEIPIVRLEGKNKASQDEDLADRHGTVQGLRATGREQDAAVAERVEEALSKYEVIRPVSAVQ